MSHVNTRPAVRRGKNGILIIDEERRRSSWQRRILELDGPFRIIANAPTGDAMRFTPILQEAPDAPVWADTAADGSRHATLW